jgi:hypothetical protein
MELETISNNTEPSTETAKLRENKNPKITKKIRQVPVWNAEADTAHG